MSPEKREIIEEWYKKAQEDLLAAQVVIEASPMLYDVAAFHAQQTAEKYLKALIVFFEIMPPKTHDLKTLMDIIEKKDVSINEIRHTEYLSMYAVRSSYPDNFEIETKTDALAIVAVAIEIKSFVLNKIRF